MDINLSNKIDQQQTQNGNFAGFGEFAATRYRGMGFKPTAPILTAISFQRGSGNSDRDLKVYIDTADSDSIPTHAVGSELYSFTIPKASLNGGALTTYTLPVPLPVTPNAQYCFYLAPWDIASNQYSDSYGDANWKNADVYAGGKPIIYNGGWSVSDGGNLDMYFNTYGQFGEVVTVTESVQIAVQGGGVSPLSVSVSDNAYVFEGRNRVTNSSFESDSVGNGNIPSGWSSFGGAVDYKGVANDFAGDGVNSFKISHASATDTGIRLNITGLTTGVPITVSVWARSTAAVDNATLVLTNEQNGSGGNQTVNNNWSGAFEGRKAVSITPNTTSMEIFIGLGAFGSTSDGTVWFDDIKLQTFERVTLVHTINTHEDITITEAKAAYQASDADLYDQIMVMESVQIQLNPLLLTKSESITVTESVDPELNSSISTSDSVTITENLSLTVSTMPTRSVTTSDSIEVTESVKVELNSDIQVSEEITLTEAIKLNNELAVRASELVTLADAPALLVPTLHITAQDSITVTEDPRVAFVWLLSTSDNVSVTDTPEVGEPHIVEVINPRLILVDGRLCVLLVKGNIPQYTRI